MCIICDMFFSYWEVWRRNNVAIECGAECGWATLQQ